ncbi:hypothetical protein [Paenarthrobacter sp. PH39-S1]|uniref:hypothetical protein n=1 Tax=Paenarthrobacter sp. PH39-S1 TaxID=3046204 RepID=UPI0024BA72D7|nr:hypothetical protein [Paenarthrobacter sp. PH39-S1]MDJ0355952.1 hypothetical protein [Paenarthrobacter sp. PH39-S1]
MSLEVSVLDDGEVIGAFERYVDERSTSGVLFAEAVVSISFDGTTIMVVFDPSSAGASSEAFLAVNPFDTLAEFVGMPIAFADEDGRRLRSRVEKVHVALADGQNLGTMTAADLYRKGTGGEWAPGL